MNVDRNIKVPDLLLCTILLSKTDIGLKRFFAKYAQFLNVVTLKMGVALTLRIEMQIFSLHWMMQNIRLFNVCEAQRASWRH